MPKIKKLHNAVVKLEECKNVNKSKGLIYLYGQKPTDYKTYLEQIKQDKKLADIEETTWNEPRNTKRKTVLITFRGNTPPKLIEIIEKQSRDTLTSKERAFARFQIVSVLDKEVWAHAIYTRDERRTFCAWVVFLAKTGGTQS